MQKKLSLLVLVVIMLAVIVGGVGCNKKVAAPVAPAQPESRAPEPPPPPPSITIKASPSAIERGQSTSLSWESSAATSVVIDNGVGSVDPNGSVSVQPLASTTYRASASGPGGNSAAEVRVTVLEPPPVMPPSERKISDEEFFGSRIRPIFFDYDSYSIRDDARTILLENARALVERRSIRLTIEGHCDERGSEKYNLALGDRRATAAKQFLVEQGVDPNRIDTISYGKERPFCTENNERCWEQNRRAHPIMSQTD